MITNDIAVRLGKLDAGVSNYKKRVDVLEKGGPGSGRYPAGSHIFKDVKFKSTKVSHVNQSKDKLGRIHFSHIADKKQIQDTLKATGHEYGMTHRFGGTNTIEYKQKS